MTASTNAHGIDVPARLRALLGIEGGEGPTIGVMVGLYFVVSIAFVLVQTTAFGLFVSEFGSQALPFAYLSVAILASLVAFLYLKLSDRLTFRAAQYADLGFLILMCLAFWIGLRSPLQHWVIFLLPFWFQALANQANLFVWHLAGHLFDVRQAKRLYGLIGAGNWLANIIGGAVVAAVLAATGTANAYFLAAVVLLISAPILFAAMRTPHATLAQAAAAKPSRSPASPSGGISPWRQPYSRLIFAYTLLWWLGFVFIDNIFYDRAGLEFPSGADLAGFIARQLSVMGVIAIITTLFLTSRVIRRYGLRTGLLAMPVVVTASILLLALGGPLGWSTAALFWIATAAKTLNVALGFSISQVAGSLLFQPLFGRMRSATQTISEGMVQPVAMGVGGVLLLLFNTILHFNAVGLSYLFLLIAVLWFWVMVRLAQHYPLVMSEALLKRSLGETTTLVFDPSAVAQLKASLRNPRPGLALYALNQLQLLAPDTWAETLQEELPGLLEHPAPEVRGEATRRVLYLRLEAAIPQLRKCLPREEDARVYGALIEALATLGDRQSAATVVGALDSQEWATKRGAILGLAASGNPEDARRANVAVDRLVKSPEPGERSLGAEILGVLAPSKAHTLMLRLLGDTNAAVRRAALRAAGRLNDDGLIPAILDACENLETAPVAEQVLLSKGERALPAIAHRLSGDGDGVSTSEGVESMVRALGRIPGSRPAELLEPMLIHSDPGIRLQVLRALSAVGFRAGSKGRMHEQIKSEVVLASRITGALQTVDDAQDADRLGMLKEALAISFREARQRILLLFSLIYHAQSILRALTELERSVDRPSAVALETVDAFLPAGLKPLVIPMLEDIPPAERMRQWQAAGIAAGTPGLQPMLASLIGTDSKSAYDSWTRMCAMHAAVALDQKSCLPALESLESSSEPGIRSMSRWSRQRLLAERLTQGESSMLSLVEKVLILKSSPLFSETPDNVLADIADLVDEIAVEKDQVVFERGEPGDSLYVIVSGKVQVWEGERLLNSLGEGDVFGELALLDPEPRLATVKAIESTRLLRLDQAHFHEVLAVRPEVSSGIIRVVTRYLRSQLQYAREVNEKLRSLESFGSLGDPSRT